MGPFKSRVDGQLSAATLLLPHEAQGGVLLAQGLFLTIEAVFQPGDGPLCGVVQAVLQSTSATHSIGRLRGAMAMVESPLAVPGRGQRTESAWKGYRTFATLVDIRLTAILWIDFIES